MERTVLVCLDLEGVLVPEIWIQVAEKTGIPDLRLTTRDIADYDVLMKRRLEILARHGLRLPDIQAVIGQMGPLDGGAEFLAWLRERSQVIILSDTFSEFALPLMRQLGYPTIFCHQLQVDETGKITNYRLRHQDQKRHAVKAFKNLGFFVVAGGDSYNDTAMLNEADAGILFRPPDRVVQEFPQFPVTHTYSELKEELCKAGGFRP